MLLQTTQPKPRADEQPHGELAEFELNVTVTTDPGAGYVTRGCDTSDTCGQTCASACVSS